MPPRGGRGKKTDEEKQADFDEWKSGEEWASVIKMNEAKDKSKEIHGVDNSMNDINDDWTEVCKAWFDMVEALKVPGRKGKPYEQAILRTMFWKRTGDETFIQNGIKYTISNASNQDTYACRGIICEIW